jgi:hypothetical protein
VSAAEKKPSFVPFTTEVLQQLCDAHGDIRVVTGEKPPARHWDPSFVPEHPWQVVFRAPVGTGESDAFEGAAHNDKTKPGALRTFARTLVVGVSFRGEQTICTDRTDRASVNKVREAWDRLRDVCPGVHMASQNDIMSLANMSADETGK